MIRTPALLPAAAAGLVLACSAAGPAAVVGTPSPGSLAAVVGTPSPGSLAAVVGTPSPGSLAAAFLTAVHQGNLAEIAGGKDTRGGATTRCVQRIGALLVRDHTMLDKAVKALAGKLRVRLPGKPNATELAQLAAVDSAAGHRAFDSAWLRMQSLGHEQTLALLDREISSAGRADLAAAARLARPIVARHLAMLRACGPAAPGPAMPATAAPGAATAMPGPVRAGFGGAARHGGDLGWPLLAAGTALAATGTGWALRRRGTAR